MIRSRLVAVAGRELRAQLASPLFAVLLLWLLFLASALNPVAMVPPGEAVVAGVRAATNSAHALAPSFAIGGLFAYTFFAAIFAAAAALRDEETGMEELLRALPLTRAERLAGKLAGVLGALGLALAFHVAALAAFRELPALFDRPTAAGPFRVAAYLLPAIAFALPWILFVAVAAFAIAERSRQAMAAYAVPILFFATTLLLFWNYHPPEIDPRLDRLLAVLDPSGIRWLDRFHFAVDRGPAFYNEAPLRFDLLFGLNRLLLIAGVGVAISWLLRSRERTGEERLRSRAGTAPEASSVAPPHDRPLGDRIRAVRAPGLLDGALSIARVEWLELRRPPALLLFTALLALAVFDVAATPVDLFGDPLRLSAGTFAVDAIPIVTLLVALYLLFAVTESWQREEATGFAPLLHSSPASDGAIALGKGAAHGAVTAWLLAASTATGLAALALAGEPLDVTPLGLVFGLVLPPTFLLWIAFVSALHALTGSRAATLGLGLTALVVTGALFLAGQLSWASNWPLWGALRWTDFAIFPLNGEALVWNRLLALSLATLLYACAHGARRRREPDALARAVRRRPPAIARSALRLAPVALLPVAVAILLAVRIEDGFQGGAAKRFAAAAQRENGLLWRGFAPPVIAHLDLRLEIDPARRTVAVGGEYRLENRSALPLSRLPFTVGRALSTVRWTVDGEERAATRTTGVDLLTLEPPIAPGGELRVGFDHILSSPAGWTRNGGGVETFVLPSAVSLSSLRGELLPLPGFVPETVGAEESERAVRWPDGTIPPWVVLESRREGFTLRLEVVAPEAFHISAVGDLVDESVTRGRRRTRWASDRPIAAVAVAAAPYAIARRGNESVYHLAAHAAEAETLLTALTAARRRYSEWFHPYPWRELRLAETPQLAAQATSYPGHVAVSEGFGFRSEGATPGGLPFRVAAHEAAHQWWGHLVGVAEGPGTGLLVEGMANYATLRLLEAELGGAARADYARDLERLYLERRRASVERPILATEEHGAADEAVLSFRGALVLERLRSELGEDGMHAALRALVAEHLAGERLATPDDLLRALRANAPSVTKFDAVAADWLGGTALPELRISDVRLVRDGDGYRVGAKIENVGTGGGRIEIEVLSADELGASERRVVEVEPGRPVEVDWALDFLPRRLVADPDVRLLQLHRERAVVDLALAAGAV